MFYEGQQIMVTHKPGYAQAWLRAVHKLRWQDFAHYWPPKYPPPVDICEGTPTLE